VPADLAIVEGYTNQLCIDFSRVLVECMKVRMSYLKGVEWVIGDVRDMNDVVPTKSVDVGFNKGTLDAMIFGSSLSPPDLVIENTGKYMDEVSCSPHLLPILFAIHRLEKAKTP
jgi:EEF1A lysine methyltransferase 4